MMQPLRRAADLPGNRNDRRPARRMLRLAVQSHPRRTLADLGRKLVGRLSSHDSTSSGFGASGKPGTVQSDPKLS